MPTDNYAGKWTAIATDLLTKMAAITDVKGVIQGDLALDSALSDNKDCVAYFTIDSVPISTPGNQPTLGRFASFSNIPVKVGIAVESTKADGDLYDKMKIRLFDWLADEWSNPLIGGYAWSPISSYPTYQRLNGYATISYIIQIN
jgi:hypothetical protein